VGMAHHRKVCRIPSQVGYRVNQRLRLR
jgi:hypothetical protein